jgi:hypothetical protein
MPPKESLIFSGSLKMLCSVDLIPSLGGESRKWRNLDARLSLGSPLATGHFSWAAGAALVLPT